MPKYSVQSQGKWVSIEAPDMDSALRAIQENKTGAGPQLLVEGAGTETLMERVLKRPDRPRRPRPCSIREMAEAGAMKDMDELLHECARAAIQGDQEMFEEKYAEALHSKLCSAVLACHQFIAAEI